MDLLIILTYVAFAWAMFKIFKIPVNKWTIPTAALGGIFIVSGLILLMNYNHPYTFKAQKAVISIPVVPQVTGVVIEVTDKKNTLIKKGEVLFRLDPTRYQARVDRLMADIVTAEHKQRALGAELDEMAANTQQAKATRDKFAKRVSALRTWQPGESKPVFRTRYRCGAAKLSGAGSLREVIGGGTKTDPEPAG